MYGGEGVGRDGGGVGAGERTEQKNERKREMCSVTISCPWFSPSAGRGVHSAL